MVRISRPESPLGSPCNFTSPTKDKGWERRRKGKIGEILVPLLYRQNYLAAEHRRDFGSFIIQTELPRR